MMLVIPEDEESMLIVWLNVLVGVQLSDPFHLPRIAYVPQFVPINPVGQVQVPPLQAPPFRQVTPLQGSLVLLQEEYTITPNVAIVRIALSATRRSNFIDRFCLVFVQ